MEIFHCCYLGKCYLEIKTQFLLIKIKTGGSAMKDKLFEPYYKKGFDHFIFKKVLKLKSPSDEVRIFYLVLIAIILTMAILLG